MDSIKVSELKILFERVIEKLEEEYGKDTELELKTSAYRIIPTEHWADFDKPENWFSASQISLGDLTDDLLELKKMLKSRDRLTTFVDFDRLASILREISEIENPAEWKDKSSS